MIYVKNVDLRKEIIKSKEQNSLTPEAIKMLILMSNRFSLKLNYVYKEDREDCIAFAILDCYLYWRGYDPEKSSNAFAYFSQIIKNGFAKGWRTIHTIPKSQQVPLSSSLL